LLLARPARWLLVPYLAWVSFAAWLNWTVVSLNAPFV
jgi:tryptophan-rich sensory protein